MRKTLYCFGVDASLLAAPITGIGRYTHEILRRLVGMGHSWVLYSQQPLVVGEWNFPNVKVRSGGLSKSLLRTLWAQTALPFGASNDSVDLLWSPAHRLPSLLSDRIARVVTIHDLVWRHVPETMRPLSRWLDKTLMPEAIRMADRVITVSEHTALDLQAEIHNAGGKVRSIPLGKTVLGPIEPKVTLAKLGLVGPYFLFVGTLEPRKNLDRLIEAYAGLPDSLKNMALLAIVGGNGWGGVDVFSLADKFGVRERVKVLGYVGDTQLATLYGHALFLAMPSLYEGFGLPLLEAMDRGTPVLTSFCASMPEVAGDAGLLVDPTSVSSIRQGLAEMLSDNGTRVRLAKNAKSNSQRFDWDQAAEETLKVFLEAIEHRRQVLR